MKTLASPSEIVLQYPQIAGNITKTNPQRDVSFWPPKKPVTVGFSRMVSVKYKGIYPIAASSSPLSPDSQVNFESLTPDAEEQGTCKSRETVHVKFKIQKQCSFGEQFMIVGDDSMVGLWNPESAIPLNWSDGHIWTLELDIPTEKTIQYKFILKGIKGIISWQPGPDRIFKAWNTEKTIVVLEDWENAALQKIMEEEPSAIQDNAGPAITSEMLSVADILTPQGEDSDTEAGNRTAASNVGSQLEQQHLSVAQEQPLVADNIAQSQENPKAPAANSVNYLKEAQTTKTRSGPLEEKKTNQLTPAESLATLHNPTTEVESSQETNGRIPLVTKSPGMNVEENLITDEGEAVLIPGLTPVSAVESESSNVDEADSSIAVDASLGADEDTSCHFQELDERHESMDDRQQQESMNDQDQEETIEVINRTQQFDSELKQDPVAKEQVLHEAEPANSNVLDNDVQWGRKTIQKLLTSFGLL